MDANAVALQRARRRYKALIRERDSLARDGTVDLGVEDEIYKLEEAHAELRPPAPASALPDHHTRDTAASAATPAPQDPVPPTADLVEVGAAPTVGRSFSPSNPPTTKPPALQPCPLPDNLAGTELADHGGAGDAAASGGHRHNQLHAAAGARGAVFLLRLWSESHHGSLLGGWNCAAIAVLAALVAVLHCSVLDPSSLLGAALTPSLFCCLVHVNHLVSLHARRQRRLNAAMLTVYVGLDAIPSLALSLAVYNITWTVLGLRGVRPASFSC